MREITERALRRSRFVRTDLLTDTAFPGAAIDFDRFGEDVDQVLDQDIAARA